MLLVLPHSTLLFHAIAIRHSSWERYEHKGHTLDMPKCICTDNSNIGCSMGELPAAASLSSSFYTAALLC